jgi:glycosyltransferase involved in cell wall biosynthesis
MASGLPIACSNRGPMPDILGEAGSYFDPENPESIAQAVRGQLEHASLRTDLAEQAYGRARAYSWTQCAASTFEFLRKVAVAA